MKWLGINRDTTPVDGRPGASEYTQNCRYTVEGELRRRRGIARTNIAKQSYPIIGLGPAYPPQGGITVLEGNTGQLDGFGFNSSDLAASWGDVQLKAPTGTITAPTGDARGAKTWDMGALAAYGQVDAFSTGDAVSPSLTADVDKLFTVQVTWSGVRTRNQSAATAPVSATVDAIFNHQYNPSPTASGTAYVDSGADAGNWSDLAPDESGIASRVQALGLSLDETINLTQTFTNVPGNAEVYPQLVGDWTESGGGATFPDDYPQNWEISGTVQATFTQTTPDPSSGEYTITITRGDPYATHFDVYAKDGDYPSEPGDGVLVGTLSLDPDDSSGDIDWTPPSAGTWAFAAVARRGDRVGPMGRI